MTVEIPGYEAFRHTYDERSHWVYATGEGAAIILIHELPHISASLLKVSDRFRQAGFRVYMPALLGSPLGEAHWYDAIESLSDLCISSEFKAIFSHGAAPITEWLRSLVRAVAPGAGDRVGVIGLCFSGGFALGAAAETAVRGAVACEPSLPFMDKADSGVDDLESVAVRVKADELAIRLFRFQDDPISPCQRVRTISEAIGPDVPEAAFETRCLTKDAANQASKKYPFPHSVITTHLIDGPKEPTLMVLNHIVDFFSWRLNDAPKPELSIDRAVDCTRLGCAKRRW